MTGTGRGRPGWGGGNRKRHKEAQELHSSEEPTRKQPPRGPERTRPESYPWDEDPDYQPRQRRQRSEPETRYEPKYYPPDSYPQQPPRFRERYNSDGYPEPVYDSDRHAEYPEQHSRLAPPPEYGSSGPKLPKKITVSRVAIYRTRQLGQQAVQAFRRGVHADGADKSGLAALTYAVMMNFALDAAIAVALANTLFFSAAKGESQGKVALYLLITVAPFALVAPVVGPLLDKLQRGRRLALAASFAGRAVLVMVMATNFDTWGLYPAALGAMVLSQSFGVLKAAVTPRVLPPDISLVKSNSRMAVFGLGASVVFGGVAGAFGQLIHESAALWFAAVICVVGVWRCLRIPAWVEVTEGEVPASLSANANKREGKPKRQPMGRNLLVGLWGAGSIRVLTGFLTLFAAFVIKAQTEGEPMLQLMLLGVIGAAAGVGTFLGNAIGARLQLDKPDVVVIGCLSTALASVVFAALMEGLVTAAIVGLMGATASALAKACLDGAIQTDMPDESRASAFGRSETILQLAWVFGGVLGLLLPPVYWIGFTVVAGVLTLGLVQTVLTHRGTSLIPGFGGDRPLRPGSEDRTKPTAPPVSRQDGWAPGWPGSQGQPGGAPPPHSP
ncbi:MFS transporter [Allokutzneria albata]|uniref:Predicted arabinose efflux permease, MFS family n=1 Tax=Allokutzneria albata TaxID=211114 RepID=A0A1H0AXV5_ALLAB|nr:MFS transporter [Allokutzneria albata]SDN38257.1 Predicted arabinose efflux permease, MFS family [Allokutzneria albata]